MRIRIVVAVALLAAGVGCSPPPERCGEEICTKEQRCTSEKKCVADLKPSISLELPMEGATVIVDTVEVKGKAQDDDKPPLVEVTADQATWVPAKLNDDGTFTLMLKIPKVDSTTLTITARARDSKLQEARAMRNLNVDNTAPVCSLMTPITTGMTNSTGTVKISLLASDGSGVLLNPRVSTDGAMTFNPALTTGTTGIYEYNWNLPIENGGSHDIVFRVDDPSGHICDATTNIFVDNVKPIIQFTMPTPGTLLGPAFFAAGGRLLGNASDGARVIKSVTLDFADSGGMRMGVINGGTWSVAVPPPTGSDYKTHVATAVVTDLSGNTASTTLSVIVDVTPPTLAITNPSQGAKLNVGSIPASGNAPLMWSLTDGDAQLNLALVLPDGGTVSPPVVPTASTDNPKTYQPVLRANDRAGNVSTATVTFTVDRVVPTVLASTPANDARMHPGIVTADFSEPMTFGAGLALNPNVTGVWTTPTHFEVAGLAKDSVYTVTTGMTVTDLHGNPVVPINYRFHTETVVPQAGGALGTGYDQVYEATADAEGTLNILARRQINNFIDWIQFNSKNGTSAVIDTFPSGVVGNLVAARSIQPDLSSRRLAGVYFNQGSNNVRYNINNGAPLTLAGAQAFIPVPAQPAEGASLAEFGTIQGGFYKRTGRADVNIGLPNVDLVTFSDTRWEAMNESNGGTESASFGCLNGCAATPVKVLGGGAVGNPNAASSTRCSIHGYLNGATEMTTLFRYQPGCGGPTNLCASDINETNNFDQVVADPALDGTFYGYNVVAGGYQIKKRVLATSNCAGAVTDVGAPITLGSLLGQPRLVVIRGQVGLIFADNTTQLRFIVP